MTPLVLPTISHRSDDATFRSTSVLYQLFSLNRDHVPASTLLQAMHEASDDALQEQDQYGRTLLLNHLGRCSIRLYTTALASREALMANLTKLRANGSSSSELDDDLVVAMRLLDRGVNPWIKDVDGRDALDQVLHLMWLPLIERLLDAPGAPDVAGLEDRRLTFQHTALPLLHHAVRQTNHVLVDLLLSRGMNVNALDHEGRTPLFMATTEAMGQRLLDAGADLNHRMPDGKDVTAYWARTNLDSGIRTRLNLLATQRLRDQALAQGQDPSDQTMEQERWRPTLYDLALTGTKDNVVKLLRTHGFMADDTGLIKDKPRRLLTTVARHLVNNPARSPSVAQHLLERSAWIRSTDDPASEKTLFTFWLGAIGLVQDSTGPTALKDKLMATVDGLIDERFRWRTPEGMARFVAAFLPWAERLFPAPSGQEGQPVPTPMEYQWSRLGFLLFHALDRVLLGERIVFDHRNQAEIDDWQKRGAAEPSVRLLHDQDFRGQDRIAEARVVVQDPSWTRLTRPEGGSYAWAWGSLAAQMFMGRVRNGISLPMSMQQQKHVWSLLLNGDAATPAAPLDAMAFNTALVLAAGDQVNPGMPGWQPELKEHQVAQAILQAEVPIDATLPFFAGRVERLRTHRPLIAMEVESKVLRLAANEVRSTVLDGPDPSPVGTSGARRRL